MICRPADLPSLVGAVIPAGPVPREAAEAIARLLLDAAESEVGAGGVRKEGEPE